MLDNSRTTLDIIIVNWNAGQQLYDCLTSVVCAKAQSFDLQRVVVVDNASYDDSIATLNEIELPKHIIKNTFNRGFAAACNQGALDSIADYLLFLNPDTKLFLDSLSTPVAFMENLNNREIGIVGIQLVDSDGMIARTCARFPTPGNYYGKFFGLDKLIPKKFPGHFMKEWDHSESGVVDEVMGAYFLVRRALFESLNGFDERFFVYYEELDFSLRAHKLGWKSYYLADAKAYHKGGGVSEQVRAARLFYSLRSRLLYGFKHFTRWSAAGVMVGTLLLEPLSRLVLCVARLSGTQLIETIKGYAMLWRDIPAIIKAVRKEGWS